MGERHRTRDRRDRASAASWSVSCGIPVRDDQRIALAFLDDIADDTTLEVPLGSAGKPFLMPGPHDDTDALMERLVERFGPDGFHYKVRL